MEKSEWFIRFNNELYNKDRDIRLLKDDDSNDTRYAVVKEDETSYYINREPNSLSYTKTIKVIKEKEGNLYDVYIEVV